MSSQAGAGRVAARHAAHREVTQQIGDRPMVLGRQDLGGASSAACAPASTAVSIARSAGTVARADIALEADTSDAARQIRGDLRRHGPLALGEVNGSQASKAASPPVDGDPRHRLALAIGAVLGEDSLEEMPPHSACAGERTRPGPRVGAMKCGIRIAARKQVTAPDGRSPGSGQDVVDGVEDEFHLAHEVPVVRFRTAG